MATKKVLTTGSFLKGIFGAVVANSETLAELGLGDVQEAVRLESLREDEPEEPDTPELSPAKKLTASDCIEAEGTEL